MRKGGGEEGASALLSFPPSLPSSHALSGCLIRREVDGEEAVRVCVVDLIVGGIKVSLCCV